MNTRKGWLFACLLIAVSTAHLACYAQIYTFALSAKNLVKNGEDGAGSYLLYDKDSTVALTVNIELYHDHGFNYSDLRLDWRVLNLKKKDTIAFEVNRALIVSGDSFQFLPDKIHIRQFSQHHSEIYGVNDKNNPYRSVRLYRDSSYQYTTFFPFSTPKTALNKYKVMLGKAVFKVKVDNIYRNGKKLEFPEEYLFYCSQESLRDDND